MVYQPKERRWAASLRLDYRDAHLLMAWAERHTDGNVSEAIRIAVRDLVARSEKKAEAHA
jgi:hypothetical protein